MGGKPLRLIGMVLLAVWVSSLGAITPARAHEVQPAVMDVTIGADEVAISVEWMIEAAVAGLNLETLENTQNAENDDAYDRLRAMEPDALAEEIRAAWPRISEQIDVVAGDRRLPLALRDVAVPEVGDLELARISTLQIAAPLPADAETLTIGWAPSLGPLVVRQQGVEDGYAAYLTPGMTTDPIPRTGASTQSAGAAFVDYVGVGFDHIVPQGLDHILFVLGLFFLSLHMGPLLWQVSAFTLAHTVTLALGALGLIRISPDIVEPLIAASIVYVGVENLIFRNLTPWRPIVVFLFGLLHGLGFASVLQDFGLGHDHFIPKLIGFNVGVELGQLSVIAATWLSLALFFGPYEWYHRRIAAPVSVGIAVIAGFWVLERTGVVGADEAWGLFTALTEGGFPAFLVLLAAVSFAALMTGLEMLAITEDTFREVAGFVTSLAMFTALVATFTSGAWILSALVVAAWVLALRLQSLGEPKPA